MEKHIKAPISKEVSRKLRAGDYVYITGTIYTARDAAHKRMDNALKNGENLPVGMVGQTIYYMGPSPAREGRPIGSAGPTTASRMDRYAPKLLDLGLTAMIGKGKRRKYWTLSKETEVFTLRQWEEQERFFQNVLRLLRS